MNNNLEFDATRLLRNMESIASRMRELIVSMPPLELLGYIYSKYLMKAMVEQGVKEESHEDGTSSSLIDENQFLLEYVHAVLASDPAPENVSVDETKCAELLKLSNNLRTQSMFYAIASSAHITDGIFGQCTADIEFNSKSSWVMLRGNRYLALEGEFYSYVLAPHDDVLREVYGINSTKIAKCFQVISDTTQYGFSNAIDEIRMQTEKVQSFVATQNKPPKDAMKEWIKVNAQQAEATRLAFADILQGGIANVSRHAELPEKFLSDLAYQRGEETDFFAPGDFVGTPYRTLPVRKKPLIQLGADYYAVDPCSIRDSGYRALLHNILKHKPDYKKTFEERQKLMTEAAFADILSAQLPDATVLNEVYYKDPVSKHWVENDTLVLFSDVLFLVEAKSGAAATIASPALDFSRHAQSVQDLVIKAFKQCERFFNYLGSAEEVPLYHLTNGKHEECCRVRRSDYRVLVPIGLTIESFSPFSTYCKEMPQIKPLLGKYAFVSLSIDDLFVLKRILPTPGEFAHYMEFRQAMAGMRGTKLFDELDHLGAYILKNRFDQDIPNYQREHCDLLVCDGMSDIIDKYFCENYGNGSVPTQKFPDEVLKLLCALDATRNPGWLAAESCIRDFGEQGRENLSKILIDCRQTLNKHPSRFFMLSGGNNAIFVWLQQYGQRLDWNQVNSKASAAALASKIANVVGIVSEINENGAYHSTQAFIVHTPAGQTEENSHIYEDAAKMSRTMRLGSTNSSASFALSEKAKKTGRNEPCPCGSGKKFKRCHGR